MIESHLAGCFSSKIAICWRKLLESVAAQRIWALPNDYIYSKTPLSGYAALLEHVVDGTAARGLSQGMGCSSILRPDRELELSPLEGNVLAKLLPQREMLSILRRYVRVVDTEHYPPRFVPRPTLHITMEFPVALNRVTWIRRFCRPATE